MKSFAIIGTPLQHTLSPKLHSYLFESLGVKAVYNTMEVQADELDKVSTKLREGFLAGINITLPHKAAFLPFLDDTTEETEAAGAANCVSVDQGFLHGHNTDIYGIHYAIESNEMSPKGKSVLILGNGGSARAAMIAFQDLDATRISIAGRRETAASQCLDEFRDRRKDIHYNVHRLWPELDTSSYQFIVNATPVGMWPDLDDTPLHQEQLHAGQTVFDFIYHPERTLLQKHALERGCRIISGIEMFIGQGLASQEHWFPGLIFETNGRLNPRIDVIGLKSFLLSILAEHQTSRDSSSHVESAAT